MAALTPPVCEFGFRAVYFSLPATDGKTYTLEQVRGPSGTLIMFICNHCPFVKAVVDRIVRDARDLASLGVGAAAIMSNDTVNYPADSFENMRGFAQTHRLPFPYLYDEDQAVARAYAAVCTPDYFGFNADLKLQYRGRLDASRIEPAASDARRELYEAMAGIAATGEGPSDQTASVGCSIKWRDAG